MPRSAGRVTRRGHGHYPPAWHTPVRVQPEPVDRGGRARRGGGSASMKRVPLIMLFVTASVLACGPFISDLLPVETVRPGDLNGYGYRGEIGVVRPHFARRYLVQAYRRMTGQGPLRAVGR